MATPKKIEIVKNITEKLVQAKGIVFADYQGLNTSQLETLREKLQEEECSLQVVKNTLLQISLNQSNYPRIQLDGSTAAVFVYKDILPALKILGGYVKTERSTRIKSGFLEKKFVSQDRLEELAKIPNIKYLKGLVVGSLNSPINNLVNALNWNLSQLVLTLENIPKNEPV